MEGERRAIHGAYHDRLYGFPIKSDDELFCRLILEINQAYGRRTSSAHFRPGWNKRTQSPRKNG